VLQFLLSSVTVCQVQLIFVNIIEKRCKFVYHDYFLHGTHKRIGRTKVHVLCENWKLAGRSGSGKNKLLNLRNLFWLRLEITDLSDWNKRRNQLQS
jgi:hypothetical protein